MKSALFGFFTLFIFSIICFGQVAVVDSNSPVLTTAPAVSAPVVAAPAATVPSPTPASLGTVSNIVNQIPSSIPAWIIALIAIVGDLILRIWPTVNPKSIFIYAGILFGLIGTAFMKMSGLLDTVVQNLKDPVAKS